MTDFRLKGSSLKLHQRRLRWHIRKNIFFKRVAGNWNGVPREVVGSLSLEVFKNHEDVVLRDVVSRHRVMG